MSNNIDRLAQEYLGATDKPASLVKYQNGIKVPSDDFRSVKGRFKSEDARAFFKSNCLEVAEVLYQIATDKLYFKDEDGSSTRVPVPVNCRLAAAIDFSNRALGKPVNQVAEATEKRPIMFDGIFDKKPLVQMPLLDNESILIDKPEDYIGEKSDYEGNDYIEGDINKNNDEK